MAVKLKRLGACAVVIILATADAAAEVTRSQTIGAEGKREHIFYSEGKKIAVQTIDDDGNVTGTVGTIPDGTAIEYYDNGKMKATWNYQSGKLDGICTVYFENGELMFFNNYKEGKRDGTTMSYYEGQKLKYRYEYKDGKLNGMVKKYYRNGTLAFEWNYTMGEREGTAKAYFKSGAVKAAWYFKDDRLEDITRVYHKDGAIKYIDTYRKGYKINRKAYDTKGKLEFEQDYPAEAGDTK